MRLIKLLLSSLILQNSSIHKKPEIICQTQDIQVQNTRYNIKRYSSMLNELLQTPIGNYNLTIDEFTMLLKINEKHRNMYY